MVDFNELIDKHLKRESRPKSIGRYYPSEIGGCIRKTWFSYRLPKETDKSTTKVFKAGEMLHEFISEVIKSEKNPEIEFVNSEIPVKIETKEFIISGRIDDLMLVKLDGKQYLVEVKSCKFLPNEAKEDNVMQLQLYMHATGIHDGILLYIKKDDLQTLSFELKYDKDAVKDILERFDVLHKTLTSQKIPDAEAKINLQKQWMCQYCLWQQECDIIDRENQEKA